MFSLKHLTQKLKLLNKVPFKPNVSSKLKPVFNKRPFSSSVFSKKAQKLLNKPQYNFSTTPDFACGKVTDIYAELMETVNNNIKNILEILPGKGINVSSFCLNRFAKMCYTQEPKLFEILYSNIEREIDGCTEKGTLLSVAEGLNWVKQLEGKLPKVPASLLDKVSKQILNVRPLLKEKTFNNIKEMLAVFPVQESENLSKLLSAQIQTYSVEDCLKVLGETENYEAVKDIFQITKIDPNRNHYQVYFPENEQTLDIFTFDPMPDGNLEPVMTFLKENTKEINLLLLEDSALFLQPNKEYEFKDGEMLQASEKVREDTELVHVLERQELEQYVQVFMHDDNLFDYNEEEQVVYTKINLQARAPSELGTTTLHFFLNADREKEEPKIVLLDLTLQETIGHMAASFNLNELKGLLDLLNYCTLIEKAYFADFCQANGCFKCRPASADTLPLPKDMISIVAGDKELPMDYRTKFIARAAIDALDQNDDNKKSAMVTGSFHIFSILREFIKLAKKSKLGELDHFNRVEHFSELVLDFNKGSTDKGETMEKLGLLESIYQAVEVSSFDNIDPEKSSIDFQKYLQALHEYGYQLSYEKLTQNNKEIKIRPGECGAETLIFGPVAVEEQFIEPDIEREKKIGERMFEQQELSQPKAQQDEDEGKIKLKVKPADPKKK